MFKNLLQHLPAVPVFAWPLILAFLCSLPILGLANFPLLGLSSHAFWGIYMGVTILASLVLLGLGLLLGRKK